MSFRRRVFPLNHLHWYWQPYNNNQETEHTNNTTYKVALVNSTTDTLKKCRLRDGTDRAWFSRLLWHPARKWSGSILSPRSPHGSCSTDMHAYYSTGLLESYMQYAYMKPFTLADTQLHCLVTEARVRKQLAQGCTWLCGSRELNLRAVNRKSSSVTAPYGFQGCKNWPAPFPVRMSYKATKPGLFSVLYLSMYGIVVY